MNEFMEILVQWLSYCNEKIPTTEIATTKLGENSARCRFFFG